ncbi:MAG: TssQ family T6SS-associated lipoprotein [Burkholderiales bacterium]
MKINRTAAALLLAGAVALAGCQSEPMRNLSADFKSLFGSAKGEPALATGLRLYEDGNYGESARYLQSALYQGLGNADRVKAHKYLAFIHCVSERIDACRDEFRKALDIDPRMELPPAEAGHPIWGPVFRSVKAGH